MITIFRWILLPFSLIYHGIIWLRNLLYDKQVFKSKSFEIPTIVIGNLAIGGTGKSPMTEYLIRLLKDKYKVATLSRGYGRKTKGFRIVDITSTALEVGDEPLQFKKKYPDITVAVQEDRCSGIENLKNNHDLVLLDDAYQHRKLNPGFSILLFDFQSLMKPIVTLPTGNFRDIFSSTKRADLVIITKCPNHIDNNQKRHIEKLIRKYNTAPIFYTKIGYDQIKSVNDTNKELSLKDLDVLLFCGIANPTPLIQYLNINGSRVHLIKFADHHNYSLDDFKKVIDMFDSLESANKIILTTEKDLQRVDTKIFKGYPLHYIPIHIIWEESEQLTFDHTIKNYISKYIN